MSTLLNYLKLPNNKSLLWWIKYYWNHFLDAVYEKKVSNKVDNSWKGVKIAKTIFPDNFPEDLKITYIAGNMYNTNKLNAKIFEYLNKEYEKEGIKMLRYKD